MHSDSNLFKIIEKKDFAAGIKSVPANINGPPEAPRNTGGSPSMTSASLGAPDAVFIVMR